MKRSSVVLAVAIIAFACNTSRHSTKIEIAQGISVAIPQEPDRIKKDSSNILDHWETKFEDDNFSVFRYQFSLSDTINIADRKQIFRKNIDGFLQPFDYKNIDSSYFYNPDHFQCNLSFDFALNDEDFRLFCRFYVNKDYFIAFCFQTPFPVDGSSKKVKDKIFNSIEVK